MFARLNACYGAATRIEGEVNSEGERGVVHVDGKGRRLTDIGVDPGFGLVSEIVVCCHPS